MKAALPVATAALFVKDEVAWLGTETWQEHPPQHPQIVRLRE